VDVMKLPRLKSSCDGFTLMEGLLIAILVFLLFIFLLPHESHLKQKAKLAVCMSSQKQVDLGFILWQSDHTNQFPWQVSVTNGGTMESAASGDVLQNFDALQAYIGRSAVFVCPTDPSKTEATNQMKLSNQNVSYFVGLDIGTNPSCSILTGDRHLKSGQVPVASGLFVHSNGLAMGWTRELHDKTPYTPFGVMSFEDGHAQLVRDTNLDIVFQNQGLAASRFDVP
jgi:hypothetical protein